MRKLNLHNLFFLTIWKSQRWHLNISIGVGISIGMALQKYFFCFFCFWTYRTFKSNKPQCSFLCLDIRLRYLTVLPYTSHYSYLFLFIHLEASIGVLEKRLFEFSEPPSLDSSKKFFLKVPSRTCSSWGSFLSTHASLSEIFHTAV